MEMVANMVPAELVQLIRTPQFSAGAVTAEGNWFSQIMQQCLKILNSDNAAENENPPASDEQYALAALLSFTDPALIPADLIQLTGDPQDTACTAASPIGQIPAEFQENAPKQPVPAPALSNFLTAEPALTSLETQYASQSVDSTGALTRQELISGRLQYYLQNIRTDASAVDAPDLQEAGEAAAQTQTFTLPRVFDNVSALQAETGRLEIADQIATAVKSENLQPGQELTVKLKPASLGELVIRLEERGGETILSITAASKETVELINRELNALKQAVSPMQVIVQPAVQQQPEIPTPQQNAPDFSSFGQGQGQHPEQQKHPQKQQDDFLQSFLSAYEEEDGTTSRIFL